MHRLNAIQSRSEDLPVVAKVVLAAEGLVADITFVGALVGVGALVDEEVVGFGELAFAKAAYELCCCC